MNKDIQATHERGRSPMDQMGDYCAALARGRVPGQDSETARAHLSREHHADERGVIADHLIYAWTSSQGQLMHLEFKRRGPGEDDSTVSISWSYEPGRVMLFSDQAGRVDPMFIIGGEVGRYDDPDYRAFRTERLGDQQIPGQPNWLAHVHADYIPPEVLHSGTYDASFVALADRLVKEAESKVVSPGTLPRYADHIDAWNQLVASGARNAPEYLSYLLVQFSQATGVQGFTEWRMSQQMGEGQ